MTKNKSNSLLAKLGYGQLEDDEWMSVLAQFFPVQRAGDKKIRFYTTATATEADYAFQLEFAKGKPHEAIQGKSLNGPLLKDVQKQIEEAMEESGQSIAGLILFNNFPFQGYFKVKDYFQIVQVPASADRPNENFRENHPFILQVRFVPSKHAQVRMLRSQKALKRATQCLQLLINSDVKRLEKIGFHWGITIEEPNKNIFVQSAYRISDMKYYEDSYMDTNGIKEVDLVDTKDFYNNDRAIKKHLILPKDFEQFCTKYFQISVKNRALLSQSLYWFEKSVVTERVAKSISFLCLVSAVESLLPLVKKGKCKQCNTVLYEETITGKFRKFFEEYATGADQIIINRIYDLRSRMSHGDLLALIENDSTFKMLFPDFLDEENLMASARKIIRIAFINFFMRLE